MRPINEPHNLHSQNNINNNKIMENQQNYNKPEQAHFNYYQQNYQYHYPNRNMSYQHNNNQYNQQQQYGQQQYYGFVDNRNNNSQPRM